MRLSGRRSHHVVSPRDRIRRIVVGRAARGRLGYLIVGATLASLILAEIIVLVPTLFFQEKSMIRQLEYTVGLLAKGAVTQYGYPTIEDTKKVGEHLMTVGPVKGGAIINEVGESVAVFGEPPSLTGHAVTRDGIKRFRTSDWRFIDTHFDTKVTGLSYGLILRLDASHIPSAIWSYLFRAAGAILAISAITACGIFILLNMAIVSPVLRVRDAVMKAIDNPDHADKHLLKWRRKDQLGELARAIDQLLMGLSVVYQEDLEASDQIVQGSPSAILQYDPANRLVAANRAALTLFDAGSLGELAARDQRIVTFPDEIEKGAVIPYEHMSCGEYARTGNVITPNGDVLCLVAAGALTRQGGKVNRYIVQIVDVSTYALEIERMQQRNTKLKFENSGFKKSEREMHQLFESCMALLEAGKPAPEGEGEQIRSDLIVNEWYREACNDGLTHGKLSHPILPPVIGNEQDLKTLFRQALTLVYRRSQYNRPRLAVRARPHGSNLAEFIVTDISRTEGRPLNAGMESSDWQLPLAAIGSILPRLKGKLTRTAGDHEENEIGFQLVIPTTLAAMGEDAGADLSTAA